MPDIIQLLPDAIANQIAAGEVVQRPASAVKELLENAVDAESTEIKLIVKDGGKTLIQVIDDGKGMSPTDARMSFERHATSKIRSTEDLFRIRTMGFRGEALASIAAVAQVEMRTRKAEDETGTLIQIEGSEVKRQEADSWQRGTSIAVKNLFFNVPARRNFLKSNPVELRHIVDEFQRVALANPQIAFYLFQQDMEMHHLPAGKLSQRIVDMFGKNYRAQLVACKEVTDHLSIEGYIGKPENAKKTRGEQFFFVNNRYIKSPYLHHAVLAAYENLLQADTHPFYVLNLTIDPVHVDINVHPTKTEIKFDDERTIYGIVMAAVKQSIGTHNLMPSIDFEQDVNFLNRQAMPKLDLSAGMPKSAPMGSSDGKPTSYPPPQRIVPQWQQVYSGFEKEDSSWATPPPNEAPKMTINSLVNQMEAGAAPNTEVRKSAFQVQNKYIVTPIRSGLMIIHQKAAHERVLYERYLKHMKAGSAASQQFLFPQQLELNAADHALAMEIRAEVCALGFQYEDMGKNTLVINGAPMEVADSAVKSVFEGLLEQYKYHQKELSLGKEENLASALAVKSSLKEGQVLTVEEMLHLIDSLFGCENPNYTPNGKKTFYTISLEQLTAYFQN
jgi:DNA mismatch repair protein MutL